MLIAFQIILLFIMFVSFFGVISAGKDVILQDKLTGTFYISLLAIVVTVIWL